MTQTVSVTLKNTIVYVTGTVNNKQYTFTLSGSTGEGTVWDAVVDRSSNDIYDVNITAIDSLGNQTSISTVLYYGVLNLITDRTQADLDRWQYLAGKSYFAMTDAERAEWDTSLRGAYNVSDLNRVGAAVEYIANRLQGYGIGVSVNPKQDWIDEDIPTVQQMSAYLQDISNIRNAIPVFADTPIVPTDMDYLTFDEANAIEKILVDVEQLLNNMAAAWFYCGDLYCGEAQA